MDADKFWNIIETARSTSTAAKPFPEALVDHLAGHSRSDILAYEERFTEAHDTLHRWDVWAAAYLIGGGCSDDSFTDFRAGLIALGRDWYEKAAASPDSLAEHPDVIDAESQTAYEALFCEEVNYAASHAFKRVAAEEDFDEAWHDYQAAQGNGEQDPADMDEDFSFDDAEEMRRRLPRLADLYLPAVSD